ncbi:hypothetical protein MUK42_12827 [Musa troglodytarum]|uniref:Bulb-type lectin domain-containing protein n=1 Tax=Musa troglodytarum TaxID=320322 RepID=A0A9E7GXA5_9LILI|nr:hypothetical protein MUK42_12827 [Musa troglodytarum]
MASLLLLFSMVSLLLSPPSLADPNATTMPTPSGAIQREMDQQILATVLPDSSSNTQPFLTSPTGKYTGYLLRHKTTPESGGYVRDFCYIQIQDTVSGDSVWESQCEPVNSANACTLVFSDTGLAVLDGSQSVWDTGASSGNNFPATLELADLGDMTVADKDGELVWKASDDPRVNQGCGSPDLGSGSPTFVGGDDSSPLGQQLPPPPPYLSEGTLPLAPASPPGLAPPVAPTSAPFAAPTSGDENIPYNRQPPSYSSNGAFGQQQEQRQSAFHGLHGVNQPLLDNNAYDSGCSRNEGLIGILLAVVGHLVLRGL